MARANPQGQQVAKEAELPRGHPLNKPPDDWLKQVAGQGACGGGAGFAPIATLSNTVGASYMTASSVSR